MVQAVITLGEREDRILTMVKGMFGFKNKSDAVNFVIDQYEKEMMELKPKASYVRKIRKMEKENDLIHFSSIAELRKHIEK